MGELKGTPQTKAKVKEIDNKKVNITASVAGCPADKGSGMYFYKKVGDKLKVGDKILTIYSESEDRLRQAIETFDRLVPVIY